MARGDAAAKDGSAAAWSTAFASSYGLAVGASCTTILAFGAFIQPLSRDFGWSVPQIALGASIISIMIMLLSPVQGFLVDRFGGRAVVLWSVPVFSASLCSMYFLPNNLTVFYAAWVIISICGIGVWPISYLRTTAGWFEKRLGLALGVTNAGIGVGTLLIPLFVGYLLRNFGWRDAYLGLGVAALTAWPVAYLFLRDPAPSLSGVPLTGETFAEARGTRPFWMALAAFFFIGLFSSPIIIHQVKIMIDAGIPPATATVVPAAFGLALLVGRLITGWLLDRLSAILIMTALMAGGALAAILYASGPSLPLAIFCAALTGFVIGSEFDVLSYIIPRYHGRISFGKIYGAIFAVFQLASAIGTYALGASRDSTGSYTTGLYVLAGCSVIAAALFTQLGPYRFTGGARNAA